MSKFSTVIPLLCKDCKLIPNVPLLLNDGISVRSIKSEHIGAIILKRRNLSEKLNSKTKCILIQGEDAATPQADIEAAALFGPFVLNVFSKVGALASTQAFTIKHVRSHSVINVLDFPNATPTAIGNYEIDQTIDPSSVKTLYARVCTHIIS